MYKELIIAIIMLLLPGSTSSASDLASSSQQPNIILITLDALRADHLGCYGYPRTTSPTIDSLAHHGTIFTHAIATSSHTPPSNASLVSSTYPNVHHVRAWGHQFSPQTATTLPVILKEHGYSTAFISDQSALSLIKGFEKGFDTFYTTHSFDLSAKHPKRTIDITDQAISWLKNNRQKKFFLWLYYLSPHGPYIPPAPYNKMFINDKYYTINKTVPISKNPRNRTGLDAIPAYLAINNIQDMDYYIALYDAEIRRVDDQIARLLKNLKNDHMDQNTIIIINADHGESLGEHRRYFCHGYYLYDELIRTPLIIYWDKKLPSGLKINQQVRTIDIMPTILDILNIKAVNLQGTSLLPMMLQETNDFPIFAYSEGRLISIRTNRWKLILDPENNQSEFYDLRNDPTEGKNIAGERSAVFKFLRRKLSQYHTYPREPKKHDKSTIKKEALDNLRSLGYAQ